MQDFDQAQRERHAAHAAELGETPFTFRGEVFYVAANVRYPAIKAVASIEEGTDALSVFTAVENGVFALIDPRDNAHERFARICENNDFPVTFEDLNDLQNWLLAQSAMRPPTQPESSSATPSTNGTNSTESSSPSPEGVSAT